MFLENLGTTSFQFNCWRFESFSCDAMHHLPLVIFKYINMQFLKYLLQKGSISYGKATHLTLTNSPYVRVVSFHFIGRSFKSWMILTGDLLTFIVVMTTSLRILLHIFSMQVWLLYVQFSFKIIQMTIWSYIKTVFTLASLKLPSNLGKCKLKYAIYFSWDIPERNKVFCFVWRRNRLINSYVTLPGRKTNLSARNRFT